jgi:hypothetical protein
MFGAYPSVATTGPRERREAGEYLAAAGVDVERSCGSGERVGRERSVSPGRLRIVAPAGEPREVPALEGGSSRLVDQGVGAALGGHDDRGVI